MKQKEFYDPDQKNIHFYSSRSEREALHSQRYYEKLKENRLRARKGKRIILADIAVIVIIMLFFFFARPFLLARESIAGCRFHVSVIQEDRERGQIYGFVKMKNSAGRYDGKIILKARYGSQIQIFELELPAKGEMTGKELIFNLDPAVEYLEVEIDMGELSGSAKTPVDRFSFL